MNPPVVSAVFRRNFVSYFSNPTGYAFICLFVILSSWAAFWPNAFFVSNLANLDQLNRYLPWILLIFIPAITMSVWADERRQGTDELLLTLPATDLDVVAGKFLAAAAIYSVSLLFSMFCNVLVLRWLGNPDFGILVANYIGYWMVGLAMLATGMVASFLSGNLTISFMLGAILNVPLVMLVYADTVTSGSFAVELAQWSVAEQFRDFGRGVISLASVLYFAAIIVVMLYLCMVMISRRHWGGGRAGANVGLHYFVRSLAMGVTAVALVTLAARSGVRADVSEEHINSLAPVTRQMLAKLDAKHPVLIEAFVSPQVPGNYVVTRLNLLSILREFEALGHGKIKLQIRDTDSNSEEADRAEKLYGIMARPVQVEESGVYKQENLFMGVAFTSGLQKVVVPFFDTGIPAEYEIARSVRTVSQTERRKIGVLRTDAPMFAGFDPNTFQPIPDDQQIITELKKQYDVEPVTADDLAKGEKKFNVLLAIQPSTLPPEQFDMFVAAVRSGIPTAVFEDPFPSSLPVTPTSQPKQPQGQMAMFQQGRPTPKGEIGKLWSMLGINVIDNQIAWQDYNPHRRLSQLPAEVVFLTNEVNPAAFNPNNVATAGLQELVFLYTGWITITNDVLKHEPLLSTGGRETGYPTGYVKFGDLLSSSRMPGARLRRYPTGLQYCLAMHITGTPSEEPVTPVDPKHPEQKPAPSGTAVNVVVVPDVDLFGREIFMLREMGRNPSRPDVEDLNFDNVTFVLNVLDSLAGDEGLVAIRNRRPQYRTLERLDEITKKSREETKKNIESAREKIEENRAAMANEVRETLDKINARLKAGSANPAQIQQELELKGQELERRNKAAEAKAVQDFERKSEAEERKQAQEERQVQKFYKIMAILLPPLFPLVAGLAVFVNRRAREREGVSRRRLR